jgi:hypothetical protein
MTLITRLRLANQRISATSFTKPEQVVSWMGAMQAQDYLMSLWGIGLRTTGCTEADVEESIGNGRIVRTWTMRRTIHFAAAEDVHWMMGLTKERVIKAYGKNMTRIGLEEEHLTKARKVVVKALEAEHQLTRDELKERMTAAGIPTDKSRGVHLLWRIGQEGITCFGPRKGKEFTFVLLDEWVPNPPSFSRDEAVVEAARRYFTSHGPATAQDFAWWSGLTMKDVRAGVADADLIEESIDDTTYYLGSDQPSAPGGGVHLLPSFDEYMISYKDRSAIIDHADMELVNRGLNGMFSPIVIVGGRIEGTWKRKVKTRSVSIEPTAFVKFTQKTIKGIAAGAADYGSFLGLDVEISSHSRVD